MTRLGCWAVNEYGEDQLFYRLVKPGPPEPPSFVTNIAVDATSVHLEWMAGFDGGYEQQFQVQVFDASTMKQVRPLRIQLLCIVYQIRQYLIQQVLLS